MFQFLSLPLEFGLMGSLSNRKKKRENKRNSIALIYNKTKKNCLRLTMCLTHSVISLFWLVVFCSFAAGPARSARLLVFVVLRVFIDMFTKLFVVLSCKNKALKGAHRAIKTRSQCKRPGFATISGLVRESM